MAKRREDLKISMKNSSPEDLGTPRRILVIAHDAMLYGAQRSLLDILGTINRRRYAPLVVIPSRGPFTERLAEIGIPYVSGIVQRWIFFPKPMTWRSVLRRPWRRLNHPHLLALLSLVSMPARLAWLTWLIRRRGISLVYTNTATVLDGAIVARICGIPHVWHLREPVADNPDLSSPVPVNWFPTFCLRWSSSVIANSRALAARLFGEPIPGKVGVLHNGVDLSAFDQDIPGPDLPGISQEVRLTAICGSVQERKDILTYVRSASHLRDSHPDLHHLIIGNGPADYLRLIETEIARHRLGGRVHLLGYREDLAALLSRIDVLISCATHEPFGRTLIEAMAACKPVIATRSGGPEEIVEDGQTGFLVNIGDDEAIAARLSAILDNGAALAAMGKAGRRRAETLFDLRRSVHRLEAFFESAILSHVRLAVPDKH